MIRIENECVGCPLEIGCLGEACPYKNVVRYYCDECKDEYEHIYHYDGQELCIDCIEKRLERVEYND
jgi:hypothetical protein